MLTCLKFEQLPVAEVNHEKSIKHVPPRQIANSALRMQVRGWIAEAERAMRESALRVELPEPVHHFADGMYARELHMPAGHIFATKIHATNHFLFILKGRAQIVDEFSVGELIEAPCFISTKPGTKRLIRVLEDSVWVTVHATEERDVDKIEEMIIAKDYNNILGDS